MENAAVVHFEKPLRGGKLQIRQAKLSGWLPGQPFFQFDKTYGYYGVHGDDQAIVDQSYIWGLRCSVDGINEPRNLNGQIARVKNKQAKAYPNQ